MQVDQFESEVESLSVQTRKKKGDKEVSVPSLLFFILTKFGKPSVFLSDFFAEIFVTNHVFASSLPYRSKTVSMNSNV